ncbi:expressed protein [Chlorella variabilis]|uniref:Expressed protein n=1 Tax=Chlorella variabilis TaxID=554065 RepID=E1ZIF4_CHLVA|nr:expressed protein [Chlorella variabilis]EFN54150.1 expressed protein [Chlorella variabilis]|eukprot:XP_005846252.1 expressed protein [Chlorella variabilis]
MLERKAEADALGHKSAMMNGTAGDRKATFARDLAALNSQFAAWVAEQSRAAPKELWTDGVEDYLQYAKQLLADFKDVLEDSGKPAAAAGGTGAGVFGFGASAPAAGAPAAGSSKPPLAPGGLFGGSSTGGAAAPASIFGALPSTGGAFALGGSAPAFGGFGSGAGSAANSGGSGLFAVPSTGTLGSSLNTGAAAAEEDEEGDEGEQDAEPSVQLEAAEGTEMLAKHRVKLMSMQNNKWTDRGLGTLTLRRSTGDDAASKRPYFVYTTDSGRVLINAPLVPNLKPTINPKTPANIVMLLFSTVDGVEDRGMHVFRCESADVAKQLLKTITELA